MTTDEVRLRVATRIREICARQGISITELARRVGTARSFVYAVLAGSQAPNLDWLTRVAEALGVDVHELVRPPRAPRPKKPKP